MSIEDPTYHDRVQATTTARVHFGLTVCGDVVKYPKLGPNLFGGGGASVNAFPTAVCAERIDEPGLQIAYEPGRHNLPSSYYMSDKARQSIATIAERICQEADKQDKLGDEGVRLTILSSAPEHIGLGSKTSLAMATAYAVGNLLLAEADSFGDATFLGHDVVRCFSGRGGTSRIGVLACEFGGVIFEDGHRVPDGEVPVYLPSSRRTPIDEPKPSKPIILPDNYRIALFMDPETPRISGQEEAERFLQLMPFNYLEVLEAIAVENRIMKPAFDRLDMKLLSRAFQFFSELVLKREEVGRQTDKAKSWLSNCWDNQYAAGVSSWGPGMFVIGEKGSDELADARQMAKGFGLRSLGEHTFNNTGVKIEQRTRSQDILADMIAAYDKAMAEEQEFRMRSER